MRRSTIPLILLAAGLCSACGARSNIDASLSGASSADGATTGIGGASTGSGAGTGGASTGSGGAFPGTVWSRRRAGTLAYQPLAVDGEGHVWLFGGTFAEVNGKWPKVWTNAHLWKLSPKGDTEIDATYDGGAGFHVIPSAIRAGAAGGVLLTGAVFRQPGAGTTLDIGGTAVPFPFAASAFVVKLDAGGHYVWSHVYDAGDFGNEPQSELSLWSIDADAAGRWYILGYLAGSADLGAGPISNDGEIVLVLSPTGDHVADRLLPYEAGSSAAFTIEPSGHMWVAVGFSQQCGDGLHVRRFDPSGKLLAEVCPPSACFGGTVGIALDGTGGVFVTDSSGDDYCGPDVFLRRIDASGKVAWTLDGQTMMRSTTVATTPGGHVVMGGSFYGTFELGSGPLASAGYAEGFDVVMGDLDPSGKVVSVAHYGGVGEQRLLATAIDPLAARVIAGQLSGVIDFGDGPQQGVSDDPNDTFFVARIPP